jgi:hypothetical protein
VPHAWNSPTSLTGLSDFRVNIPTWPGPFFKLIICFNYNKMVISKICPISSSMRWDSHSELNGRRTCDGMALHEDDSIERNRDKPSNQMRGAGTRYSSWLSCTRERSVAPSMASEGEISEKRSNISRWRLLTMIPLLSTCPSLGLISFDTTILSVGQHVSLWTPSFSWCDFVRAKSSESWSFCQENSTLHLLKGQLHGPVISTPPPFRVRWSAGMNQVAFRTLGRQIPYPGERGRRKGITRQSREQDRTVALLRRAFLVRLHSVISRFVRVPTYRSDAEMKSAPQDDATL